MLAVVANPAVRRQKDPMSVYCVNFTAHNVSLSMVNSHVVGKCLPRNAVPQTMQTAARATSTLMIAPCPWFPEETQISNIVLSDGQTYHSNPARPQAPAIEEASMSAMLAESGDSSTHIISPAIVDDNEVLDSYLSSNPAVGIRRITRTSSTSSNMGPPSRRVLFNTVLKKPLGIHARQTLAASKLEVIEKLLEPHVPDLIDLHVTYASQTFRQKANKISGSLKMPIFVFLS
jgi:hypothetical protein